MKKFFSLNSLAMAFTSVFLLSACSNSAAPGNNNMDVTELPVSEVVSATPTGLGEKIIRVNNSTEPGTLHPALASGTHDSWVLVHTFEGLFDKGNEGEIRNAGAESYEISENGLTWTFKLREDSVWSNGEPVTAHDYEYAWLYVLNPETAARYASQLYVIKGAQAYNTKLSNIDASQDEQLRSEVGVKAIDDFTLEVTLENPTAYLPDLLTHYTFYPINAANQELHPDWSTSPDNYVSNGRMVLSDWKHRESITLTPNTYHRDSAKTYLDAIEFVMIEDKSTEWTMYQQGELDLIHALLPSVVEQLKSANNPEFSSSADLSVYYFLFNTERVPFNNVKVRNALSMAINREVITTNITKGDQQPAYNMTSHGIEGPGGVEYKEYLGKLFDENIEEAQRLLAEGLAEEGMEVSDFTFSILYNTDESHKRISEAIQSMWKQNLGLNVSLENAEFQVTLDRRQRGEFDVARAGWVGDYADPLTFLEIFASYSDLNDSSYNNPEFDELIAASMQEVDSDARLEILKEAETILVRDMPMMPVYHYVKTMAKKPYVDNVILPNNRYPILYDVTLNTLE